MNNESGGLETHDLLYFLSHGFSDRWWADWGMGLGLGTAEASLGRVIEQVTPENHEAINDKLRRTYGQSGADPVNKIIEGEFSFA